MRLSDLQNKDIISIVDGSFLGNIIDAEIKEDGSLVRLIIYNKKSGIFSFKNKDEVSISWTQIKKIGNDVILIDKNS